MTYLHWFNAQYSQKYVYYLHLCTNLYVFPESWYSLNICFHVTRLSTVFKIEVINTYWHLYALLRSTTSFVESGAGTLILLKIRGRSLQMKLSIYVGPNLLLLNVIRDSDIVHKVLINHYIIGPFQRWHVRLTQFRGLVLGLTMP